MLRIENKPQDDKRADRSPGSGIVALPPSNTGDGSAVDLWGDVGDGDLLNTIRRIGAVSGWSQPRHGAAHTMAVASAVGQEGKTTIAEAVSVLTAHDVDSNVLLIECDLTHPCLAKDFQIPEGPGLSELLASDDDPLTGLVRCLRPTRLPNLWLLPAGVGLDGDSRLLRSSRMADLLEVITTRFGHVVLDLPAVLTSSDAAVLARLAEGVVFVVRAGVTERKAIQQALWLLSGATIHGVVLNRRNSSVPSLLRPYVEF